jgi:large subunit ribosomal protein L9
MKVLLLKDYPKVGKRGELKDVSDGLARNLLIPKKIAQVATPELEQKMKREKRDAEEKKERDVTRADHLKSDIEKKTFSLPMKVGDRGQVFGGIREKDIIEVINKKMGTHFDKSAVRIKDPIKKLGIHTLELKLAAGVVAKISINIEALT